MGGGRLSKRGATWPRLALARLVALGALVSVTPAPVRAAATLTVTNGNAGGFAP